MVERHSTRKFVALAPASRIGPESCNDARSLSCAPDQAGSAFSATKRLAIAALRSRLRVCVASAMRLRFSTIVAMSVAFMGPDWPGERLANARI